MMVDKVKLADPRLQGVMELVVLDTTEVVEEEVVPDLVSQVKVGFEAMVGALEDYRERLRQLEAELRGLRSHCEGHCAAHLRRYHEK